MKCASGDMHVQVTCVQAVCQSRLLHTLPVAGWNVSRSFMQLALAAQ